jgi:hypothetical protein
VLGVPNEGGAVVSAMTITGLFLVTITVEVNAASEAAGVNEDGQGSGEQISVAETAKAAQNGGGKLIAAGV